MTSKIFYNNNIKNNRDTELDISEESRLSELQNQIQDAEMRCHQLKQHLASMKYNFEDKKMEKKFNNKIGQVKSSPRQSADVPTTRSRPINSKHKITSKIQVSPDYSEDSPEATISTINQMLQALAKSTNKLDDDYIVPPSSNSKTETANKHLMQVNSQQKSKRTLNQSSCQINRAGFALRIRKKKPSKAHLPISKSNKKFNRLKENLAQRSVASVIVKNVNRARPKEVELQELFHNRTVESESESAIISKKLKSGWKKNPVPLLQLSQVRAESGKEGKSHESSFCVEPQKDKRELYHFTNNYRVSTIASRMKQIARRCWDDCSYHSVPFCLTKSTSPSHNIGINIQQYMNWIKTKQPQLSMTPFLTYKLGLAAERFSNHPLSALVSTLSTKFSNVTCPLMQNINYKELQKMAKAIPEENEDDMLAEISSAKTFTLSGPSGDLNIKNQPVAVWTKPPSENSSCTCVQKNGLHLEEVIKKQSQICSSYTKLTSNSRGKEIKSHEIAPNKKPSEVKRSKSNIKQVLNNLCNDFESLNKRYNHLEKKIKSGSTQEDEKAELVQLEDILQNKEKEIKMVVSLYDDILALKNLNLTESKSKISNKKAHLKNILTQIQLLKQANCV